MAFWTLYLNCFHRKDRAAKASELNFYVANDNKDCVQVKGEIGLGSLWQRHLIKLPLVTLETAEAIIKKYPMPSQLIKVNSLSYSVLIL